MEGKWFIYMNILFYRNATVANKQIRRITKNIKRIKIFGKMKKKRKTETSEGENGRKKWRGKIALSLYTICVYFIFWFVTNGKKQKKIM